MRPLHNGHFYNGTEPSHPWLRGQYRAELLCTDGNGACVAPMLMRAIDNRDWTFNSTSTFRAIFGKNCLWTQKTLADTFPPARISHFHSSLKLFARRLTAVMPCLYSAPSESTRLTNPAIAGNCREDDVTALDAEADSQKKASIWTADRISPKSSERTVEPRAMWRFAS